MALYENLTQEQKDNYQAWERDLRAWHGSFHQLIEKGKNIQNYYNAVITAILVDLDDNTVVPNSSGLADAVSLDSDAEAVALQSHINAIVDAITGYDTIGHRQLRAKAAGINATL